MSASAPPTLPELLDWFALDRGDLVAHAVVDGGTTTYGEWQARSARLAGALRARGLEPGDCVVVMFGRHAISTFGVAFLAANRCGAVAMPLPEGTTQLELNVVLDRYRARAVIADRALVDQARAACSGRELLVGTVEELETSAEPWHGCLAEPEQLASVVFTSGTTGTSKAVAITHEDQLYSLRWNWPGIAEGGDLGTLLHASPLSVVDGQWAMLVPLVRGLRTVTLPQFSPEAFLGAVERYGATDTQLVPSMAIALAQAGAESSDRYGSLRQIALGSAPCPPFALRGLRELFPQAEITIDYSTTESGCAGTATTYRGGKLSNVGKPYHGTRVRIVDEDGRPLGANQVGEVELGLAPDAPRRSYFRDPQATREVFRDGWVRTGDVGHLDEEGRLYLVGRRSDVVNVGGLKVSSWELERVLEAHPAVAEAAVVGVPHSLLGEEIVAFVVPAGALDEDELRASLAGELDPRKLPQRFVVAETLPRTATGKVIKSRLAEQLSSADAAPPAGPEPEPDDVLGRVREAVAETLGRDDVGADDDLLELAPSSLDLIRIYSAITGRLGIEVGITAVFRASSIRELAEEVGAAA